MVVRARHAAAEYGVNVTFCWGDAERLPLDNASMDVALVNGIFKLCPAGCIGGTARAVAAREAAHALLPGP